jgi:hypothetical protein
MCLSAEYESQMHTIKFCIKAMSPFVLTTIIATMTLREESLIPKLNHQSGCWADQNSNSEINTPSVPLRSIFTQVYDLELSWLLFLSSLIVTGTDISKMLSGSCGD